MINEDRVILMTKLASYESGPGKKNVAISNYFRGDYIGFQILQSIISATLAFAIVVGIYLFYHFEDLMLEIYQMDLMAIGKDALKYYLITVVLYCVLSYIVYSYRYHKARKSLKNYYHNLRKLTQS
jgi:hypothetical protein